MISFIQGIWIVSILIMMLKQFKIGLALYLAYILLVPYMSINLAGVPLQWNFVNLLVFVLALYNFSVRNKSFKIDYKPLYPFLIYYISSFFLMLFQNSEPFQVQLDSWRIQIMKYLILPFALWNEMRYDKSSIKLYRNVTLICISIAIIYGLLLTAIPGLNPYIMILSQANGSEFNTDYALAFGEGRLFGRISSVFAHPMTFGMFLGVSLIYLYYNRGVMNKYVFLTLFLITGIDILVCGVRSTIGGVVIAIIFYLLQMKNYKLMLYTAILGIIGYYVISSIPDMSTYIGSITDIHNEKQDVSGSSIEMRIEQLNGCFKEIEDCLFTGKGFSWTGYYKSLHGDHPVILSFESLIFIVLCNSGLIGIFLWIYMGFMIMKYNTKSYHNNRAILNALFIFYIAYSCITGEYGYMQYFVIFYILMLGESKQKLTLKQKG